MKKFIKILKRVALGIGIVFALIIGFAIYAVATETPQEAKAREERVEVREAQEKAKVQEQKEKAQAEKAEIEKAAAEKKVKAEAEVKAKAEAEAKKKAEVEAKAAAEKAEKADKQKELAYMAQLNKTTTELSDLMGDFTTDVGNYSPYNQDSIINLSVTLVSIRGEVKAWKDANVEVPAKYQKGNETFNQALDKYDYVMSNLPKALDDMDANRVNELASMMNEANGLVAQASVEMKE